VPTTREVILWLSLAFLKREKNTGACFHLASQFSLAIKAENGDVLTQRAKPTNGGSYR